MDDSKKLQKMLKKTRNGLSLSPLEEKQFVELQEKLSLTEQGTIKTKVGLAEVLGVSRKTIYQWIDEGGMPVEPDGRFDPDHVLEWRGIKQAPDEPGESAPSQKNYWDVQYRKFKALLGEVEYKKATGELISRAEVEALLVDRAVEFKKALLGRGRRLSLRLAHKDAQECQAILDADSLSILETYARENTVIRSPKAPEKPETTNKRKKTGGAGEKKVA